MDQTVNLLKLQLIIFPHAVIVTPFHSTHIITYSLSLFLSDKRWQRLSKNEKRWFTANESLNRRQHRHQLKPKSSHSQGTFKVGQRYTFICWTKKMEIAYSDYLYLRNTQEVLWETRPVRHNPLKNAVHLQNVLICNFLYFVNNTCILQCTTSNKVYFYLVDFTVTYILCEPETTWLFLSPVLS